MHTCTKLVRVYHFHVLVAGKHLGEPRRTVIPVRFPYQLAPRGQMIGGRQAQQKDSTGTQKVARLYRRLDVFARIQELSVPPEPAVLERAEGRGKVERARMRQHHGGELVGHCGRDGWVKSFIASIYNKFYSAFCANASALCRNTGKQLHMRCKKQN